jgi:predicted ferric reductase
MLALWVGDGAASHATESTAALLIAAGEVAALIGTALALLGMALMARVPIIERTFGETSARNHGRLGAAAVLLLCGHVVATVAGFALSDGSAILDEAATVILTYPWMLAAAVAMVMLLVVGCTSIPWIRHRLSFETWSGLHLYVYLAMILGLGHQLAVGSDFLDHPLNRAYWVGLFVVVFALVAVYRVAAPIILFARHQFRVDRVVLESGDVVSIYISGRRLERLSVKAGQYFRFRLLARDEWWRCHPFSISAEPDGNFLRFTVKSLGDYSERLQNRKPGSRVMLEGPCGALTTDVRRRSRVALIAGGIGVTPLRALFEELAGRIDVKMIYRATSPRDAVFSEELEELAERPGAEVAYLVGKRGNPNMPENPLSPAIIASIVPDIASRDVYVCGPLAMMQAVFDSLHELGVPSDSIHSERFAA